MAGSLWEHLKNKKSECVCLGGGLAQQVMGLMEAPGSVATEWVCVCV